MTEKGRKARRAQPDSPLMCGIIRPIAALADYSPSHWRDVHDIIAEAASTAGYQPRLVSDSDAAGVILSEIITNIYNDPIVIADVSGKNPNVMFELGLRMAFEKPVIIIADDATDFSFDISPVKHLKYPRSLRYQDIIAFKSGLSASIKATVELSHSPEYRGYLQQFGPIHITQLETQNIALDTLGEELVEIKRTLQGLAVSWPRPPARSSSSGFTYKRGKRLYDLTVKLEAEEASELEREIDRVKGYISTLTEQSDNLYKVEIDEYDEEVRDPDKSSEEIRSILQRLSSKTE